MALFQGTEFYRQRRLGVPADAAAIPLRLHPSSALEASWTSVRESGFVVAALQADFDDVIALPEKDPSVNAFLPVTELLREYDQALAYTDDLWRDLSPDEVTWRPHENSSAIGWHLGHQAHVAHFMVRNLTAAEPSPDPELDGLMDSANPEKFRGALPTLDRLLEFRRVVAERVHARVDAIAAGQVGAPQQMTMIATQMLTALINHEYQHDQWIGEVRAQQLGHALPGDPSSPAVCRLDGYLILNPLA